jgi:hypothetical protein
MTKKDRLKFFPESHQQIKAANANACQENISHPGNWVILTGCPYWLKESSTEKTYRT